MAINDMFGRSYETIEEFRPATIDEEIRLYAEETDRYLGLAIKWRGIGWSHSYHNFGEPASATLADAVLDFSEKLRTRGAAADRHCGWVRLGQTI